MKRKEKLVTVTVEMEDWVILALALEAHGRDMKLNDYIVELLEKAVKENSNGKEKE